MEKIKDINGFDITVYTDKIDQLLHEFYYRFISDDKREDPEAVEQYITESPQNRFNAALMYIGNTLFKGNKALKADIYFNTPNTPIRTNNNKFNYDILNFLSDIYIFYCSIYDKQASFFGYSYFAGISIDIVIGWKHPDKYGVSPEGLQIYEKISRASEQSLAGMLTGRRNPVGVLGILNHLHGWNMPGVRSEKPSDHLLTAADLPKLDKLHKEDPRGIEHKEP